MKQQITLSWLIENNFVRQVEEEVYPRLERFDFITDIKVNNHLTVFFYGTEIEDDLLIVQRDSYYIQSQEEWMHVSKVHVIGDMKLSHFATLLQNYPIPKGKVLSFLTEREQGVLTDLELKRLNDN